MRRYSTEIFIPADRYVALQLPEGLPEGRAIVIVQFLDPDPEAPEGDEPDSESQDIEWWEEFEDVAS